MSERIKLDLMESKPSLEDELKDQKDFINYQFEFNGLLDFITEDGEIFTREIKGESLTGLREGVKKFKKYCNDDHKFKEDQSIYSYRVGSFAINGIGFVQKEIEKQVFANKVAQENWGHYCDVLSDTISRILSNQYHTFLHLKAYPEQ